MNIRLFFFSATLVCGSSSTSYTRVSESLIDIPGDIPTDTKDLDLSRNQIASVDFIPGPLPVLSEIDLSNNLLTEFPDFSNCSNVSVVILDRNALTHISADRLDILTRLTRLSLTHNSLQTIPDVPGPGNTLSELFLSNNDFSELSTLQYLGRALQKLHAAHNHIGYIPRALLEQLKCLTQLSLGSNQITSFPDIEPILENLEILGLTRNNDIDTFPSGLFPRLPRIAKLQLSYTDMSTIPMDICLWGTMSMGFIVDLKRSPIHCDQEMRWLRLAEEAGVDVLDVTCETPDSMAGRAWETVTWEDLSYHGMLLAVRKDPGRTETSMVYKVLFLFNRCHHV